MFGCVKFLVCACNPCATCSAGAYTSYELPVDIDSIILGPDGSAGPNIECALG